MRAIEQSISAWISGLRLALKARRIQQLRECMRQEMRLHAQHMRQLEKELDQLEGKPPKGKPNA